tara:strand:+ start:5865 stop:7382 length:1518 start_codon:yes stop_codon:yes gene_type:complete
MIDYYINTRILPLLAYINLSLILIFLYISFPIILTKFKKIGKKYWLIILIVLLIGVLIRLFLVPHHHRFFIDESFYIGAAKNLLFYFKSTIATGIYPKQIGWPALLTIPFFLFGVNNYVAIYTSIFFGSLSVILMYILVYLLSKNARLAIISSFLLAILPLHAIYSGTAETIIASVFFLLATLISFIIMIKNQQTRLIFLTVFLFLFTIQIRLENILILIPMLVFIFLNHIKISWKKWRFPLILSLPLLTSYLFQFFRLINFYDNSYNGNVNLFGFNEILIRFMFDFSFLTILFLVLTITGIIALYSLNKRTLALYLSWFSVYLGYYLFYQYSNDFHLLTGLIALVPIMAYGVYYFSTFLSLKLNLKKTFLLDMGILIIILFLFFVSFDNRPIPGFLLETKAMEKLKEDIPKDCIVITEIPVIITSIAEVSVIDTTYFLRYIDEKLPGYENKCLLYYEDFYCKNDTGTKRSLKRCDAMHSGFKLDEYKKYNEMDVTFYLYNISKI